MPRTGIRPTCQCGQPVRSKGRNPSGIRLWDRKCAVCRWGTYTRYKKDYCELCGFVALHRIQLDVDHIDGNHNNNEVSNLQTLCANCHRLKTHVNNDYQPNRIDLAIVIDDTQMRLDIDA